MSLLDLRAYFQRGHNTDPCRAEKPEPGGAVGWLCSMPTGHDGRHVAHDIDGTVITTWTPREGALPAAPVDATPPPALGSAARLLLATTACTVIAVLVAAMLLRAVTGGAA